MWEVANLVKNMKSETGSLIHLDMLTITTEVLGAIGSYKQENLQRYIVANVYRKDLEVPACC